MQKHRSQTISSGWVSTYKRGGGSKHNRLPCPTLDVALLLVDGSASWSGLLSKLARVMKAADAGVMGLGLAAV
ncbi:hypothetical protein GCM10023185_41980 [Hymenobacter saemangeumensis]|uniref:VWA domain-containing protein n=1 Tax=Hymenobacter saemangeumensis TaxID=1084522 RepID=A0ABP8IRI9_9BACT